MIGGASPAPFPNASATQKGVVTAAAQTFGGLKTFRDGIIAASLLGAGVNDICNKIGTSVADASVAVGATLLSIRTGLGATETEYARFSRATGLGPASLNLYQQSRSNTPALTLFGAGSGSNGISFESYANNYIGVGSGFVDFNFTNSCFRFSQNNDAFSPSAPAIFDFQAVAAKAYPHTRLLAASGHTGKLISMVLGASEKFSVDANGSLVIAGNATFGSGVTLNGNSGDSNFGGTMTFGTSMTIAPFLSTAEIAASGKAMFLYAAGTSGVYETIRAVGQRADAGLKCFVAGTENATPNAGSILLQVGYGIGSANTDAANGTAVFRIYGDGKIGVSGAVNASAVGAVAKKLQIYDATGASLGFIPIYTSIT